MPRPLWLLAALACVAVSAEARGTPRRIQIVPKQSQNPINTSLGPAEPTCKSGAGTCLLQYYAGHVIPNVKVYQVNWTNGSQQDMASYFASVTNSSYLDWLNEYNTDINAQAGSKSGMPGTGQQVGRGVFAGTYTIGSSTLVTDGNEGGTVACGADDLSKPPTTNCCLSDVASKLPAGFKCIQDSQIADELQKQITAGNLPANDENSLYFTYFPPNIIIGQGGSSSCQTFCGYHSTFSATGSGASVYYAVMPDFSSAGPGCNVGCGDSTLSTTFAKISEVSSHELAESITDPEVGIGTAVDFPIGWYDSTNGEIGDICAHSNVPHGTVGSFVVQRLFSNLVNAVDPTISCVLSRTAASDFSIAVSPNKRSITAGAASTTVSVTSATTGGSSQTLTLSTTGVPAGVSALFGSSATTTVSSGSSATLTLSADSGAAAVQDGVVQIVAVNDASTPVTHTAGLLLQVAAAAVATNDFTVSMTPTSQGAAPGDMPTFSISTTQIAGTGEAATLTVTGLPSSVHASFASATTDPTTGSMTSTDGGSDTLTLTVDSTATAATIHFNVNVATTTPDAVTHAAAGTLIVALPSDFTVAVSPKTDAVVLPNAGLTFDVTTTQIGPTEDVTFSIPDLPSGFGPPTFTPSHANSGSGSKLTVSAPSTPGSYPSFTIVGTDPSGTTSHSDTTGSTTVTSNNFSLSISPATTQTMSSNGTKAFTVSAATVSGTTADIALSIDASTLPTGVSAAFDTATIQPGATGATLTLTSTSAPAVSGKIFTVIGQDGEGLIHNATGSITVAAVNDFSVTPSSTSLTVARGSSTTVTVNTAVTSGAPGNITLSTTGLPSGVTGTFSAGSVTPGNGSTLTIATTASASLTSGVSFTVTGTAGSTSHSASITLIITGTPGTPTVSITHPSSGNTVSGSVEIDVTAVAATGSTLSRIDVLVDGTKIGTGSTSPAQVFWTSTEATNGSHAITATALDADTGTATSAAVNVTVNNSGGSSGGGKGGCSTSGGAVGALALLGLFALRRKR